MITKAVQSVSPGILCLTLLVCSCDFFSDDSIKKGQEIKFNQNEFYTLPNSSIVIDLGSIIEQSFISATITISKQPLRGKLSQVNSFLLKYRPARQFEGGDDHFEISLTQDDKVITTKTITIHMKQSTAEFPCALIAVEDKIKVKAGSSVSESILDNDWLCNVDKSRLSISILSAPLSGTAVADGASITYVPGSNYKGRDELIYKITAPDGGKSFYGLLSANAWTVESLDLPNKVLTEMVFLDDTIGYLAGEGVYKTIDGGKHWNQVLSESANGSVSAIHFVDANHGFATHTYCKDSLVTCTNGLVTTSDGGTSWKHLPIHYSLNISSVFFTSSTTGFVSGLEWPPNKTVILKTTDAGKTWTPFVIGEFDALIYRDLELKYANASTGFGFQNENIFITRDAGEVWEPYTFHNVSYDDILCLDVIDENTFFAGLSFIGSFKHPTSIVKFVSNSAPKEVAVIPHKIWELEFSPTGDVGFALGVKGAGPQSESYPLELALYKSTDKGENWSEEYIDEYLYDSPYFYYSMVMSVPSDNVVYILYADKLLKYYK